MAGIDIPMTFTVRRRAPELIVPAKPTPQELKPLSDIDDHEILRLQMNPIIMVYRGDPKMRNKNPASVIREALAKLLVFYYPFAGRLKEGRAGKLMVDCSGEGVLFIEAEADITLDQFGDALLPPFPCLEELLYDVPSTNGILGSPLLLIQVTRLLCEGFIFAIRVNHTMTDGAGLKQFLSGLGEIARGTISPSKLPVWQRELLLGHQPPNTFIHRQKLEVAHTNDDMVHKSFFFTTTEISALRSLVPTRLQSCSTFEVLTACLWRCRAIALQPDPEEEMPIIWPVDARKMLNPPLSVGYYGNVLGVSTAVSKAVDLCNKPLGYALELVTNAKSELTKLGYIRSIYDLMALKGRLYLTASRVYSVSNVTRLGFDAVDFGWGKAAYAGIAKGRAGVSHLVAYTNTKGESGIVAPICLPSGAMDRFVKELNTMLPALSKL